MTDVKSGKASFMAVNMIVDSDSGITASSQAAGVVSKGQKEGAGSATAVVEGSFAGLNVVDFYVEIETTGEIGAATFKWSNNGGSSFVATGVATSTGAVALQDGVTIRWNQGSGDDVVAADFWRFKGYLPYGRRKIVDRDRDTEWRSTGVSSESLTFDLGSAQQPQALVVMDHNLTAAASIRLQGANVSNFSALLADYVIPWQSGALLSFLGAPLQTARYWRLQLSDAGNTDGYLRIAEVFLGAYTRLSRSFELGDLRGKVRVGQRDRMLSGKFYGAVNTVMHAFDFSWVRLSQTDRDTLIAVFDSLNDLDNHMVLPVFFNPMDTDLTRIYLCEWSDQQIVATAETDAPERYTVPIRLVEIPRTLPLAS